MVISGVVRRVAVPKFFTSCIMKRLTMYAASRARNIEWFADIPLRFGAPWRRVNRIHWLRVVNVA